MASYTEHYGLHQWEPDDNFLRTDFNTDLKKIDTGLGKKSEMATGQYTGNGAETQKILLAFTPKVVILTTEQGETYQYPNTSGGIALEGYPLISYQYKLPCVNIVDSGFQVGYQSQKYSYTNKEGVIYHYVAFQ